MLCLIWDNFERYKLRYSEGIWIVSFSSGVILSEAISWKWTMDWLLAGFQQMRCWDFPKGLVVKTLCFHCRCGFDPRSRRRQWQPTLVLLPGKFHGRRSLVGCIPWGREESDTTEQLSLSCIAEGNGNPLQCSCLENPRDGGAWWAAVYGVTQSQTRLKWLSSSSKEVRSRMMQCPPPFQKKEEKKN